MKKTTVRQFLPLAITLVTIFFIALFVDVDLLEIKSTFSKIGWVDFLVLMALCYIAVLCRAIRLSRFTENALDHWQLVGACFLHQGYSYFLPFKMGEAVLPACLKSFGIPLARGIATLFVVRLSDLMALLMAGCIAILLVDKNWLEQYLFSADLLRYTAFIAFIGILVLLFANKVSIAAFRQFLFLFVRLVPKSRKVWFEGRIGEFVDAFGRVSFFRLGLYSILILALLCAYAIFLFSQILTPQIPLIVLLTVALLSMALSTLPINGIAGIGSAEVIAIASFQIAGISPSTALSIGIVMHTLQLIFAVTQILCGYVLTKVWRKKLALPRP